MPRLKGPLPFTGRVRPSTSVDGPEWNWKQLPEDHPERVRIEAMFAGIKPLKGGKKLIGTLGEVYHL